MRTYLQNSHTSGHITIHNRLEVNRKAHSDCAVSQTGYRTAVSEFHAGEQETPGGAAASSLKPFTAIPITASARAGREASE